MLSSAAFAHEYETKSKSASCWVSGDVQSITNDSRPLQNTLPFRVSVTERYFKSWSSIKRTVNREVNISANDFFELESAHLSHHQNDEVYDILHFKLSALDNDTTKKLLIYLGATPEDVEGIKGDFSGTSAKLFSSLERFDGLDISKVEQFHYPLSIRDGLSFHIKLHCFND